MQNVRKDEKFKKKKTWAQIAVEVTMCATALQYKAEFLTPFKGL